VTPRGETRFSRFDIQNLVRRLSHTDFLEPSNAAAFVKGIEGVGLWEMTLVFSSKFQESAGRTSLTFQFRQWRSPAFAGNSILSMISPLRTPFICAPSSSPTSSGSDEYTTSFFPTIPYFFSIFSPRTYDLIEWPHSLDLGRAFTPRKFSALPLWACFSWTSAVA